MSLDYSKVFVFVMSSFSDQVYIDFIKMHKLQFEKFQINHAFLFDNESECPPDYRKDKNDYFFDKTTSPYSTTPHPELNPSMILKFLKAIRMFDLSKYDYILRVNLSTYINYNLLLPNVLQKLPKQKLVSGYCLNIHIKELNFPNPEDNVSYIVSGCFIIFSYDSIQYLKSYDLNNSLLYQHNDDVILTIMLRCYAYPFIEQPMLEFGDFTVYNDNIKLTDNYCFIRIKHTISNRLNDVTVWRVLLKKHDQIDYP